MTAPNRSTLWGEVIVDELAKSGLEAICLAPGSRCTPLTVAAAEHEALTILSHLDERSAAFFALGRARRTGDPVGVVTTSGTAAANCHPAVIEAYHARVPIVVLTADRPADLQDSGANQTVDQANLYGDAVRSHRTLPEPAPEPRRLRSVRTAVCRAVGAATGTPSGPVHLNVPFPKPLEPTEVPGDVPSDLASRHPLAVHGRDGPFVDRTDGAPTLDAAPKARIGAAIDAADRGLVVAGPARGQSLDPDPLAEFAAATGFPVLADPLSGVRFGSHVDRATICGGYDGYVAAMADWPAPDVVVRVGASPTSRALRKFLHDVSARQFVVDPAGGWPEAEFTASDLVVADPDGLLGGLCDRVGRVDGGWSDRFARAEAAYWETVTDAIGGQTFEGAIAAAVVDALPDPGTLYVSNSMPVRDVDRFARPREGRLRVLGNRGASGIDGLTSSALGAASAGDAPLVALLGDLAYYHDTNGLLAAGRCGVDATVVVVNNDGGGIFHELPIEGFDPPFTELFRTPHDVDFAATGDLHGLAFERVSSPPALADAVTESVQSTGTRVVEVRVDAKASHRRREAVHERAVAAVRASTS